MASERGREGIDMARKMEMAREKKEMKGDGS
jgi:hypothetical protein